MADPRKSQRESGWLLPDAVYAEQIGVCVPVPNDDNYRRAFLGALYELTWARNWQHDGTDRGLLVSQVWKEIYFQVQADLHEVACGEPFVPCLEYPNTASFIEYGPNDVRYEWPGEVPECYASPPWYRATDASNLAYGSQDGDIICTFERLPIPPGPPFFGCLNPLYPWIKINLSGIGQLEIHLRNLVLGSQFVVTRSDDPLYISFVDVNKDVLAAPPETEANVILEFEFTAPGDHWVQLTLAPAFDAEEIPITFGGGISHVVLCGFDMEPTMDCCDEILRAIAALRLGVTQTQNQIRQQNYDGTPQSVNPSAPASYWTGEYGDNFAARDQGFCMTVATFVFASVDAARKAAAVALGIAVGEAAVGLILGPLTFIAGALTVVASGITYAALDAAIQNEDALRDVICQLYDTLYGTTFDQSALQSAINTLDTTGGTDWITIQGALQLQAGLPSVMPWLADMLGNGYDQARAGADYEECGACNDWRVDFDFTLGNEMLGTTWDDVFVFNDGWWTLYTLGLGFALAPDQGENGGLKIQGGPPVIADFTIEKWAVTGSDLTGVVLGVSSTDNDPPNDDVGIPNAINTWGKAVEDSPNIYIRVYTAQGGPDKVVHKLTIWGSGTNPWEGL